MKPRLSRQADEVLLMALQNVVAEIKALRSDVVDLRGIVQKVATGGHDAGEGQGPWLTMQEAGKRLNYKSRNGIYEWVKANGIQRMRRGRQWLVAKRDIDAAIGATQRKRG